jgi:adenine-specific methyltransferase EcoRI-like protein
MARIATNKLLTQAKTAKKDEFYTVLSDIERELKHYKRHFKNKVVFCNCDDPRISNFFHYFSYNFKKLELKKLITTCYKNQERDLFSRHDIEKAIYLEYEGDINKNNVPDPEEIGIKHLKGDGDFRSKECIELLEQTDIVVTNPPFSLFREYVSQLIEFNKKFLVIGTWNATKYKDIFRLIKENKVWIGINSNRNFSGFIVPKHYSLYGTEARVDENGNRIVSTNNNCWFTNLDNAKRHEELILYKTYNEIEYPKYDNYDAINVDKTNDIPMDYSGVMGVPITFINKYNPEQFEILGMTSGRDEFEATPIKKYINPKQINKNGSITNGSKANTSATLRYAKKPEGVCYTADNVDGYLKVLYTRFLIRNKKLRE